MSSCLKDFCEDPKEPLGTFKTIIKKCYMCELHIETATLGWIDTNYMCRKPYPISGNNTASVTVRVKFDFTGANPKTIESAPISKSTTAPDRDRITLLASILPTTLVLAGISAFLIIVKLRKRRQAECIQRDIQIINRILPITPSLISENTTVNPSDTIYSMVDDELYEDVEVTDTEPQNQAVSRHVYENSTNHSDEQNVENLTTSSAAFHASVVYIINAEHVEPPGGSNDEEA